MNFIEGELKNKKLKTQAFEIAGIKSDFNGKVILGIRPEHLVQAYNGLIKLNVDLVEKLGSDNLVYGEIKGKKDLLCYRTPGNEKINSGSKLDNGSSNKKILGLLTIALPIATLCLWPPDNNAGLLSK